MLNAAEFGLVNYFCRLHKTEERVSALAWCFQVPDEAMLKTARALGERSFVTLDAANDPCVRITREGKAQHKVIVGEMAPDVMAIVAEIAAEDLETTARTLQEIRRTMDNLPDR